jgi:L-ascorbate metabolism protein UlaG (beta-lactamase superfamily)
MAPTAAILAALSSSRTTATSTTPATPRLTYDMKLIGETAKLDFAIFPIGDFFTMGIEDALRAAEFVGVSKFVGVHYDTFPPIKLDHEAALATARKAKKELLLPAIGETIVV